MKDDLTRRGFLRATGLAFAAVAGVFAASSNALAQETDEKKKDEDDDDEDSSYDDLFGDAMSDEETRACPQCGAIMYKQGNTWTCETCGYSYVE